MGKKSWDDAISLCNWLTVRGGDDVSKRCAVLVTGIRDKHPFVEGKYPFTCGNSKGRHKVMEESTRVVKLSEWEGNCSWVTLARMGLRAMVSTTMMGVPFDVG